MRVFPLSNWTELDVWHYIHVENIPVVPLYFAREREVIVRGNSLIVPEQSFVPLLPGERPQVVMCRMRSLGCSPCTGAVRSHADTIPKIIEELVADQALRAPAARHRPRSGRVDGNEEARGLLLMSTLLRLCTAGSVDDGKSTLIGRLLYEARAVYEDQLSSVKAASRNRGAGPIDFSLFTDGLKAEREQGITIDVAYRYFATARRKFILADTPGHEQYTRNMATGASTADLAILLVDARHGVREQTRRHARIARLLGISHLVLAVNKMDLVGFDRGVFESIRDELRRPRRRRRAARHPAERAERRQRRRAQRGNAVVHRAAAARVPGDRRRSTSRSPAAPFRFPVQLVVRPNHEFRGYAGQIASGTIRPGDRDHGVAVRPPDAGSAASSPGTATWRRRTRRCR